MSSLWHLFMLLLLTAALAVHAEENARADVVVIVDTSTSMKEPGMDPERASLLVAKLLADIVPGDLAVVRLLGIGADRALLPSRLTHESGPCPEDPRQTCPRVERASDWEAEARKNQFGVLIRPQRGDADYKHRLDAHLEQRIGNSMFALAFKAAQGVFDGHPTNGPRLVIWLSDGNSEHEASVKATLTELQAAGVEIEAIVFGAGDTRLPREAGVEVVTVGNPAEMMNAFANAFRRIVQAPYRIDNRVQAAPSFSMKRNIREAWIVVYGDKSLGPVQIKGPGVAVQADYAADIWPSAGAYKVAYLQNPPPGDWTVDVQDGGAGVAYAVIQRSDLVPVLLAPNQALSGAQTLLVAGIASGQDKEPVTDAEVLKESTLTADLPGQTVTLRDDGTAGDAQAQDGRYSGYARFSQTGPIPVRLRLQSAIADRRAEAVVNVSGSFRYNGGPLEIDFGPLGVNAEACRPLPLQAEQQGEISFALRRLKSLPSGHTVELRTSRGGLRPDSGTQTIAAGEALQLCLQTAARVASSQADGEPWLLLHVAGSTQPEQAITLKLRWHVVGLSFWQMWGGLILSLLAMLLALFLALGFILPQRFRGALALVFVPDREDLDEQSPQPVKQWRGVGIGFYRNARAWLHPDYRLSGQPRGALAGLFAERGGNRIVPGHGVSVFRETLDGDWEAVPPPGCRCRPGDVFRIGGNGPYFRIASRG